MDLGLMEKKRGIVQRGNMEGGLDSGGEHLWGTVKTCQRKKSWGEDETATG